MKLSIVAQNIMRRLLLFLANLRHIMSPLNPKPFKPRTQSLPTTSISCSRPVGMVRFRCLWCVPFGSGFRGLGVQGFRIFRVQGFRVQALGFRGLGFRGLGVQGLTCPLMILELLDQGFGLRVSRLWEGHQQGLTWMPLAPENVAY